MIAALNGGQLDGRPRLLQIVDEHQDFSNRALDHIPVWKPWRLDLAFLQRDDTFVAIILQDPIVKCLDDITRTFQDLDHLESVKREHAGNAVAPIEFIRRSHDGVHFLATDVRAYVRGIDDA
jgi:hypothetical protein